MKFISILLFAKMAIKGNGKQLLHSLSVILRNLLSRFILEIFVSNKYSMTLEQLISPLKMNFIELKRGEQKNQKISFIFDS